MIKIQNILNIKFSKYLKIFKNQIIFIFREEKLAMALYFLFDKNTQKFDFYLEFDF